MKILFRLTLLIIFFSTCIYATTAFAAPPIKTVIPVEKSYYLAIGEFNAVEAPSACIDGYHFASIWEIAEPSNLQYNNDIAESVHNGVYGPPTYEAGWVRIGTMDTADECMDWTSASTGQSGKVANLNVDSLIHGGGWNLNFQPCSERSRVWCVSDPIY